MRYFVYKDAQVLGPYAPEELDQAGPLHAGTLVCPEDASGRRDSDWRSLGEVAELSSVRTFAPALLIDEPLGHDSGALERLELDTLGVPTDDETEEGRDWLAGLFEDPDFKKRWLGVLPTEDDDPRTLEQAKSQISELSERIAELQRRIEELQAGSADAGRTKGSRFDLPASAAEPALDSHAAAPPPPPSAAPAQEDQAPAKGLRLKVVKPESAKVTLRAKVVPLKVVGPLTGSEPAQAPPPPPAALASAAAAVPAAPPPPQTPPPAPIVDLAAGGIPPVPIPAAVEPPSALSSASQAPGLDLPAAGRAPVEAPSTEPPGAGLPPAATAPSFAAPPLTSAPPLTAPPVTLEPPATLTPAATLAAPTLQPAAFSAPPMTMAFTAPPATAIGGAPVGMPPIEPPPIPTLSGSAATPFSMPPDTLSPEGANAGAPTLPGGATPTQDVLARLAKPAPQVTEVPKPVRRGPPPKVLAALGALLVAIVGGAFYFLLGSQKDLKNMVAMEPEPLGVGAPQEPAANPFDQQTPPVQQLPPAQEQPAAPGPAATPSQMPPATDRPANAEPPAGETAAPAPLVQDLGEQAIDLVKQYPLDGDRGTVAAWLQFQFASNPGDGAREEWTAGGVDATTYLVQYRVLTQQGGAAGDGLSYVFEANVATRLVMGKNPPARRLLSGASAPARPARRAKAPVRKKRAKRRVVEPKVVPLIPLPSDSDLLPPAEDDATFRGDTVNPGL